ncbi:MAG: cytochrome c maturation protein CcmE [Reyranellaceae bacterium]
MTAAARRLKPKHRRLVMLGASLLALAVAAFLILRALNENLVFFYSPTMVVENKPAPEQRFRIGGLVEDGSVQRGAGQARFRLTDGAHTVSVVYAGALPDLFREGQGIVANGALDRDGVFVASEVLAKHDENYMPPEVAEALKKSGRWKHAEPAPAEKK